MSFVVGLFILTCGTSVSTIGLGARWLASMINTSLLAQLAAYASDSWAPSPNKDKSSGWSTSANA